MNTLWTVGLSNVAVALVLAALAYAAGRYGRRPALTHGLWLLVLLKLLTPPLFSVPVIRTQAPASAPVVAAAPIVAGPSASARVDPAPEAPVQVADAKPSAPEVDRPAPKEIPQAAPQELPRNDVVPQPQQDTPPPVAFVPPALPARPAPPASFDWSWLPTALGGIWLAGAAAWFLLAAVRVIRFHRLLRFGQPAPAELRKLAKDVARRLDVRCPRLVLVPGTLSPMLWVFGSVSRLVLPASLVDRLTPEQWRTLFAHELAHWRRRDHWVRWIELAALGLYWWCPLVWWAKRELQQAEEECCDAWVVSTLPEAAREYALALVETVDFLSGARAVLPPAASGLGHVHLLQRRLTMILRGRTPRALTLTGLVAVLLVGMLALPLVPTWAQAPPGTPAAEPAQKDDKGDAPKADPQKALRDYQKLQEDLRKLQQQMDEKRREFEEKLTKDFGEKQRDLMKQMQDAMQKAGAGGFPAFGPPGGFPGALPGAARLPGGALPPGGFNPFQPGAAPPGGFGPNFQPGAMMPGFGAQRPDLERRLDELEKKLDRLLQRLGDKGDKANPPNRDPNAAPRGGGISNLPAQPGLTPQPAAPNLAPAPGR
jgi:beta-lactamase regulating signal transducer with metallopeptidase domain